MMKTIFFCLKLNMVKNLRLKIVLARKRPVCCTLYSKKHTCIIVVSVCILQSIMYFSCVTATNSHCTQRCFHLISHVVFSFSSFFSLFLFFCLRLSFAKIWFSSCVLSTTSLLNQREKSTSRLQLERTPVKLYWVDNLDLSYGRMMIDLTIHFDLEMIWNRFINRAFSFLWSNYFCVPFHSSIEINFWLFARSQLVKIFLENKWSIVRDENIIAVQIIRILTKFFCVIEYIKPAERCLVCDVTHISGERERFVEQWTHSELNECGKVWG